MIPASDQAFYDEPVFPEEEQPGLCRRLDFFGLTIPPLHRELRRRLHHRFESARARDGLTAAWVVPRHWSDQMVAAILDTTDPALIPDLIAVNGLGSFVRPTFVRRWFDGGLFTRAAGAPRRAALAEAGFTDPLGHFLVYAALPMVILVDLARLGRRPVPRGWGDLLDPCYRRDIIASGQSDQVSPMLLHNFHHDFGDDGLRALAGNLRGFWPGARMARAAGGGDPDGAAVYILPRFWALNNIHPDRVVTVWPAEGAYANPLMLFGKSAASAAARMAGDFLTGRDWAGQMEAAGCVAGRDDLDHPPPPGPLRWIGWSRVRDPEMAVRGGELADLIRKGLNQ